MKIFSPHRRKMEAKRRYGGKEFQNKVKKNQEYKRVFDPRTRGFLANMAHKLGLDSLLVRLVLAIIVLGGGYYLAISPYFLVTQIDVSGNMQVPAAQVQDTIRGATSHRWIFIPQNHLLLMSRSNVQDVLVSSLPLVREIKRFKRVWPNKIEVEIVERHPGFVFSVDGKLFLVDDEGLVVKELPDAQGLPVVVDQVSEPIKAGERLNNTKLVGFVLSASRQWPNKINSQIKEIKIPGKAAAQVQFVTSEGWGVFFDTGRPVEAQLSNLSLILSRQIPAKNRLQLAYIDLRFDKWAYYCYKNSPCEAQPQTDPNAESIDAEKVEVGE